MDRTHIKLLIAGGRDFDNYKILQQIGNILLEKCTISEVVSGTARGADKLGERWANENNILVKQFPADWSLGKQAGYLRNETMGKYCDCALIFWDGQSRGTKHMIDILKRLGKKYYLVYYQIKD